MAERPHVAIVFTGGTISMLPDASGAAVPRLRGAELLARTEGLDAIADVEAVDWGLVPASHLRFAQILEIARIVAALAERPDVDGVVVVQGTDVLEETAFAWDLVHDSSKPVVVVGAMHDAADPAWDGARNLRDAVALAAHPDARDRGVLVAMAGLVLAARDARKTHSRAVDAFQAPDGSPIGRVVDGVVELAAREPRTAGRGSHAGRLPSIPPEAAEPIPIITAVASTDGDLLRAAVERGARGVVVAATGSGNTDPDLLAAAREAMAAGVPVVLVSRCGAGGVGPVYGFPGGGATWQAAGVIMGGTLSGPAARVALALGLGAGLDLEALRQLIAG
jgi:L-asparaginase